MLVVGVAAHSKDSLTTSKVKDGRWVWVSTLPSSVNMHMQVDSSTSLVRALTKSPTNINVLHM